MVAGGVLIATEPDVGLRPRRRTVLLTLVTGVVHAADSVGVDATPSDSGAAPTVSESAAAVSALHPATTVGPAVAVLHERVRAQHAVGLLVAVAGVAGLALARG